MGPKGYKYPSKRDRNRDLKAGEAPCNIINFKDEGRGPRVKNIRKKL